MASTLLRCRVADFDTWRAGFEAAAAARPEILSFRIWRGADDPNLVVLLETFESREAADGLLNQPGAQELMAAHGVDVSSVTRDFIEEAATD